MATAIVLQPGVGSPKQMVGVQSKPRAGLPRSNLRLLLRRNKRCLVCENTGTSVPGKRVWRILSGWRCFEVTPEKLYVVITADVSESIEGREIKKLPRGVCLKRMGQSFFYTPAVRPKKKKILTAQQ
jgi:hypothetical protein